MAVRSTRNKIRFQLVQIIKHLEGCQVHLKFADDLAQGTHPLLIEALPGIVCSIESLKDTMFCLRDSI